MSEFKGLGSGEEDEVPEPPSLRRSVPNVDEAARDPWADNDGGAPAAEAPAAEPPAAPAAVPAAETTAPAPPLATPVAAVEDGEYHDPYGATPDHDPYGENEDELPPLYQQGQRPEGWRRFFVPKIVGPLLLVVVILLWAVGGCGAHKKPPSSSTNSSPPSTQTSKTQTGTNAGTTATTSKTAAAASAAAFIRRADSVCRHERVQGASLARRFTAAKTAKTEAEALSGLAALYGQSQRRLAAFKASAGKAALYRAWLGHTQRTLSLVRQEVPALKGKNFKTVKALDAAATRSDNAARPLARRLGFKICGR